MNNYGFKRNRNSDYLNGLRVPLSNSNHLIYSRQSSNNNITASSPSTSNPSVQSPNRHSINICNNMLAQVKEQPLPGNRSNVQAEVHSPSEPQENKAKSVERLNNPIKPAVNRHLTFTKNQQIMKDEITQLNDGLNDGLNDDRRQSSSSEANSLNDQNLNCQLQARRKSSITNGQTEIELNDKTRRLRRYSEKDKDLNLPLLKQGVYHEYDQPANLLPIYDQSMNCCQNSLNSNSLNIRKTTSCNCNQRAMNGFNGGINHVENGEDDERQSLV